MQNNFKNILEDSLKNISLMAFEQSYSSVVITSADVDNPLVIYVNPAFIKQTGYSYEEVIGRNPKMLQGENTDRAVIDRLKKALQERTFFEGTTVNYKKDGSEYYVEWNISPIFDDKGELNYFISFQTDITSKVKLTQKNEELLLQQSKLATVGELMNAMAHQWKQPLSVIHALSHRLLRKIDKDFRVEDLQTTLETIVEQTTFMNETISSFQNFLRPIDIYNSFDINKSIEETLILMQDELMGKSISVEFSSVEDSLEVNGSENEFKQVILNILSNARDAFLMQNKSIKRKIDIELKVKDSFINIDIIDNAGGIKMFPIEKIFENNVSSKGANGTGIGLYIVKKIITRLKGEINVSLDGDTGTRFSILLPLK
ncbi:sensor histidine kinase [Sulfurimonas aquatica]|nr:PAS domain-containing protein [Sulfurimonas aquatica]